MLSRVLRSSIIFSGLYSLCVVRAMSKYVKHSLGGGSVELALVPMFDDNYGYIIVDTATKDVALVDPADPPPVFEALKDMGLKPTQLWCTHYHDDHQGGNAAFKKEFPDMHIYGPSKEPIEVIDSKMDDGSSFSFGQNMKVSVIHVPCHTKGHIAFYGETEGADSSVKILAPGDTLFMGGVGKFFEGTAEEMLANMDRLVQLPDDTIVCSAHEYTQGNFAFANHLDEETCGETYKQVLATRAEGKFTLPTTIGAEKKTNLFMMCNDERLQGLVSAAAGQDTKGDPAATMKMLRSLKNNFK